jgi:hypothetical protein
VSTSTERMRRLRERRAADQAAALMPVPDAPPRDPEDCLLPACEATIAALRLDEPPFQAMAAMLRVLAQAIDEAADQAVAMRVLGPELRRVLEAVGGTPAARAKMPQRAPQRSAPSRIAIIRNEHMNSPAKRRRRGA